MKKAILILCLVASPAWAADCYVSEYANLVIDESNRLVPVAQEPAIAVQRVTYTTSTQSSAFNTRTRFIRIVCDAAAHFEFGTNPSATADNPYLPSNTPEYFGVPRGASFEIAVYDGSS